MKKFLRKRRSKKLLEAKVTQRILREERRIANKVRSLSSRNKDVAFQEHDEATKKLLREQRESYQKIVEEVRQQFVELLEITKQEYERPKQEYERKLKEVEQIKAWNLKVCDLLEDMCARELTEENRYERNIMRLVHECRLVSESKDKIKDGLREVRKVKRAIQSNNMKGIRRIKA